MGLRFRKSVKICNGLRLNFGKTGASVTVGSGSIKKTFNTNGNVTTTVGIPGTGVYWTETERHRSRTNSRTHTSRQSSSPIAPLQSDYQVSPEIDDYFAQARIADTEAATVSAPSSTSAPTPVVPISTQTAFSATSRSKITKSETPTGLSAADINNIFLYADEPVDWTELIAGATADDLFMDLATYNYCSRQASRILSGDVDAYLEVINRIRPVDDLALYSGDFEFGTDNPSYIEVEFCASPERVLRNGSSDNMLEEFVSAIAIRVARDLMALLPVTKVLVHVEIANATILSVIFNRNQLCRVNFKNMKASDLIRNFTHLAVEDYRRLHDVGRLMP